MTAAARFAAPLVAASLLFAPAAGAAPPLPRPHRIFLVNSYDPGYFWSAEQQPGVRAALEGLDFELREFFMDTKRNPGEAWLQARFSEALREIEGFNPDLIFTGDDNATKTVARHFLGGDVPVVFYGVNAEPEGYGLVAPGRRGAPGGNVTGVLERHFFTDAGTLMQTVCKANGVEVSDLYLLSDDSYTSGKLFEFLRTVEWGQHLEVHFLPLLGSFDRYREVVRSVNHPGNALFIYNVQTLRDAHGTVMDYRPILEWTRREIRIPTVGFHERYIEQGLLLGIVVSGYSQAYHAGLKGRRILEGTPAGEIPIDAPSQGRVVVNSTMLKKLGLKMPLGVLLGATVHTYPDE